MRTFGLLVAALLLVVGFAYADDVPDNGADDWRNDLLLPGFANNELRGESLRGEPVLLQFWASWCRSCGQLMSEMSEVAARFASVRYLVVSIDENAADARRRLEAHPQFPLNRDRFFHDSDQQLSKHFEVVTVPTVLVIGADGRERLRHRGHFNSSDLTRLVSRLADLDSTSEGSLP